MIRALLIALIVTTMNSASAQSLDALVNRSAMISQHFDYLKHKNVVSIYTSTKQHCPGFYWWTSRHTSSERTKNSFLKQLGRQMSASGFSQAAISYCVKNSGFVLENGKLTKHIKNTTYTGLAHPGTMILRNLKTGTTVEAPMVVETRSYDDKKFAIFDQSFQQACTLTSASKGSVRLNCPAYGVLDGTFANQDDNRKSIAVSNARYQMLIVTSRPVSFARRSFAQTYK